MVEKFATKIRSSWRIMLTALKGLKCRVQAGLSSRLAK